MSETINEAVEPDTDNPEPGLSDPSEHEPDDEEAEADEQASQPVEPEQIVRDEADYERMRKQLERSATTWRNRVSDVLGAEASALVPCELCDPIIPGFHWPAEVETARDETHARLLEVLRTPQAPEYPENPQTSRCVTCQGWGKVISGSRVAGKELLACPACTGYGYTPPPTPTGNGYADAAGLEPPAVTPPTDIPLPDVDAFGSPRLLPDGQENPNYGRMPAYKLAGLP